MNILGIDPGSRNCGYAIIKSEQKRMSLLEAGFIKMREKNLQYRIVEFIEGIDMVLKNHHI